MHYYFIIILFIVIMDQGTKYLVSLFLLEGDSIPIIQNVLYFNHVLNPGAAFGFLAYQTTLFVAVTVLVVLLLLYLLLRLPNDYRYMKLGFALQVGGALGNLIDRVRTGYVIDFLYLTFWPPVFNLADVAIVGGIVFLALSIWRENHLYEEQLLNSADNPAGNIRFRKAVYGYKVDDVDSFHQWIVDSYDYYLGKISGIGKSIKQLNKDIRLSREREQIISHETGDLKNSLPSEKKNRESRVTETRAKTRFQKESMEHTVTVFNDENEFLQEFMKELNCLKKQYIFRGIHNNNLFHIDPVNNKILSAVDSKDKLISYAQDELFISRCQENLAIKESVRKKKLDRLEYERGTEENTNLKKRLAELESMLSRMTGSEEYLKEAAETALQQAAEIEEKSKHEAEKILAEARREALLSLKKAWDAVQETYQEKEKELETANKKHS